MNLKSFIAVLMLFVCACAFGAENVVLRFRSGGNVIETKTVPLKEVEKGIFRLQIPKAEIPKVDSIDILADDAVAQKGDEGYWVVGDGRLGYFTRDNGTLSERRNPLPIYGVKKGDKAFVGIVKGLKYEFEIHVDAKDGKYEVYPRFLISEIVFDPYEDLIVDFYNFKGDEADYSSMGKAYRKYQLARGEVEPLRKRVKGNPQLAYTADSMFVRLSMGSKPYDRKNPVRQQTPDIEPPLRVHRTFDQTMEVMRNLKKLGVDKAEVCFVGWNSGGFDGRFPTLFPADPAYGGTEKMKEATALGHSLGYQMVCHVCNTDFYRISNRFDEADVAKTSEGRLRPVGTMSGGMSYNPCFKRVYEKYIPDDFRRMLEVGLKGTHHIDVTSCITPYPCFDPDHPCTRQDTADYMNKIGELADKSFGGFGSEGPCDHVAKTLDYALYIWAYPKWVGKYSPLMDRLVPLWQITYHGIILSNPYYATIDYNYEKKYDGSPTAFPYNALPDIATRRLKLYEFGGRPTFYGGIRDDNLKPIKEAYDEYQPMKYLQFEFMDYHGELAPDVFVTRYSDGSEVVSNYTDRDFSYKGETVKAKDYKLFKPSAFKKAGNWFKSLLPSS